MCSLLLDTDHPRRAQADFDTVAPPIQCDFAEALAQLAMYPPGRAALLQEETVIEALQQVAAEGWTDEARRFAESALAALTDRKPSRDAAHIHQFQQQKHVMLSCECRAVCLR